MLNKRIRISLILYKTLESNSKSITSLLIISEEVKMMIETQPVRVVELNRRAVIVAVMMSKYN